MWLWALVLCVAVVGVLPPHGAAQSGSPAPSQPPSTARADTLYSMSLRSVPLPEALEQFAAVTQVSLAYDADLVRGLRTSCAAREVRPAPLLRCLLADTGLDYVLTSNETFIVVKSAQNAPRYGQLAGVVVDASTGEPLPHANLLLADAATGTATNETGMFHLASLIEGPHRVVVSYVGYETQIAEVEVEPGEQVRRRIELQPKPYTAEPVIIDGLLPKAPSDALGEGRVADETLTRPQSGAVTPDVAQAASTLLGIATRSPLADLYIQGGDAGEHEMMLDGAPVRNPASIGRLLSAMSPLAIGRLTTHKAGYGAMRGSYLSGVVELKHDLSRRSMRWARLSVDPVSTNARLQGATTIGGRPVTAMASARVGLWNVYRAPSLNQVIDDWSALDPLLIRAWTYPGPRSSTDTTGFSDGEVQPQSQQPTAQVSDWHAAARIELTPYRYLQVSGYHGRSTIGADLTLDDRLPADGPTVTVQAPAYDRYHWDNTVGQVRYEWLMGGRAIGAAQVYGSHYEAQSSYRLEDVRLPSFGPSEASGTDAVVPALSFDRPSDRNATKQIGGDVSLDLGFTTGLQADLEVGVEHVRSQFRVSNAFIPTLEHDVQATRVTAAAASEIALGNRTTLEAGTRLTYAGARRTVYAEPRLALRYDRSTSRIGGYALRVAGGLYRQFTNQFDISRDGATAVVPTTAIWLPSDYSLAPPRAYHLATEALWTPNDRWQVDAEAYAKLQPHLLEIDYPALRSGAARSAVEAESSQDDFVAPSEGHAIGAGIRVQYAGERLTTSVSYSVSRAERTFPGRFDGRRESTPWNEPHRLDASVQWALGAGFSLQTQWTGIWSRSWGFRKAYYDYLSSADVTHNIGYHRVQELYRLQNADPSFDQPSNDRLPTLLQIDAGVAYDAEFAGVRLQALLQVTNVLNRDNVVDQSLVPSDEAFTTRNRTLPGRLPTLSLSLGY